MSIPPQLIRVKRKRADDESPVAFLRTSLPALIQTPPTFVVSPLYSPGLPFSQSSKMRARSATAPERTGSTSAARPVTPPPHD